MVLVITNKYQWIEMDRMIKFNYNLYNETFNAERKCTLVIEQLIKTKIQSLHIIHI